MGIGLKLYSNGPEAKTDFSHGGLIGTLGMTETELFVNLQCFQGELKADKKIQYTIINNRNKISHVFNCRQTLYQHCITSQWTEIRRYRTLEANTNTCNN